MCSIRERLRPAREFRAPLGAVGRAYDPLLERLIGHPVVVPLDTGDAARAADLILPRPRAILRYSASPR